MLSILFIHLCNPCKASLCYLGIGTSQKGPLAEEAEADIPHKPLPEEVTLSTDKAVEVQPCTSNVQDELRYPESEGRQIRSQTGSLPVPTKMTMAEEMNSKTHI